jgi:hypothetical protein
MKPEKPNPYSAESLTRITISPVVRTKITSPTSRVGAFPTTGKKFFVATTGLGLIVPVL